MVDKVSHMRQVTFEIRNQSISCKSLQYQQNNENIAVECFFCYNYPTFPTSKLSLLVQGRGTSPNTITIW